MADVDVDQAVDFVWRHSRLLDRRRFSHHFRGPDREGVVAALAGYRNSDGGFGWAVEPDCRTPASQPTSTQFALQVLDEVDGLQVLDLEPTADWLASVAADSGGVPFSLPSVEGYPRASWWAPEGDPPPANVNPTAGLVGLLRKAGVTHTWLDAAETFCWEAIDALETPNQYEAHNAVGFLLGLERTARVERAFDRVLEQLASGLVIPLRPDELDGSDPHTPLMFAPSPDHPCRRAFSDETIDAFLDILERRQEEDGAWPIGWDAPGQTAVLEWRAIRTIQALRTLRAYGRVTL